MNKKVIQFRNKLAESGIEFTPEKAAEIFNIGSDLIEKSKNVSQLELWSLMDECKEMSEEEREEAGQLLLYARDLKNK